MNEPHCSSRTEDIYDDLNSSFNPKNASVIESKESGFSDVTDHTETGILTTIVPSQSLSTSNFSLNEDQLKKEEMILYLDLVVNEMENKKALSNLKIEYMNLKEETDALKKSLKEKDDKISQLTAEVINLKKNICSLYKTAKSEIEQKDAMLEEANKQIDKKYSHKDKSEFQNKLHSTVSSQCQPSTSRMSNMSTQDFKQHEAHFKSKDGQNYKDKRKRSYETFESENPSFTSPSSYFNPSDKHLKWNNIKSKDKFPHHESKKFKYPPSHDNFNIKCNSYNDKRNNYTKSKNNQTTYTKERSPQ